MISWDLNVDILGPQRKKVEHSLFSPLLLFFTYKIIAKLKSGELEYIGLYGVRKSGESILRRSFNFPVTGCDLSISITVIVPHNAKEFISFYNKLSATTKQIYFFHKTQKNGIL